MLQAIVSLSASNTSPATSLEVSYWSIGEASLPSVVDVSALNFFTFQSFKESVNTDESWSVKDEGDGESEDEEYEEEFDSEEVESDNEYDLDGKSNPSQIIFSPYQMTKYAKLLFKVHET